MIIIYVSVSWMKLNVQRGNLPHTEEIHMAAKARVCTMCTCQVCSDVRAILDNIFNILKLYGPLLDAYIVDFFQDDLWSKLPLSWQTTLSDVSPQHFGSWILGESTGNRVWPLSLLALRQSIKLLTIDRDPGKEARFICSQSQWNYALLQDNSIVNQDTRVNAYQNHFSRRIKQKKRYEIEKFSKICAKCTHLAECKSIVDTGAGMGHLARELAYKYTLPVICIEQNEALCKLAENHDEKFLKTLQSKINNFTGVSPYHLCCKIEENSCSGSALNERLQDIFIHHFGRVKGDGYGLIGLHPCGDLASTLLKLYVKEEAVKFISVVGCCYMKLTVNRDGESIFLPGYPLSEYIINKTNCQPSFAALEVACHAIENYCDKMKTGQYDDLKVHAYRATLEMILIKKGGVEMKHGRVGSVKVKDELTFDQYCKLATGKLEHKRQLTSSDIAKHQQEIAQCLERWRQVVTFEAVRFMLSPLVENVVLLDRFLYLSENKSMPILKAEFDPRRSPRNFVLTAIKQ